MKNLFKNQKFKYGFSAVAVTLVVIAVIIVINLILGGISKRLPMKLDLTPDKVFELSEQTKDIMKSLNKDITVYTMYPEGSEDQGIMQVKEFLEKYSSLNPHFKTEHIDLEKNPGFQQKYAAKGDTINTQSLVFDSNGKVKILDTSELFSQDQQTGDVSILAEQKITAAVAYIIGEAGKNKVCFIEGHDEANTVGFIEALKGENYDTEIINLTTSEIPEDTIMLICLAPVRDFLQDEISKLDKYMSNKGKFFYATVPGQTGLARIDGYLKEWGIINQYDFVVEKDPKKIFSGNGFYPMPDMQSHEITEKLLGQKIYFLSPQSCSFDISQSGAQGGKVTPLLLTSKDAYGKTNLESETIEKESGDVSGPLNIAVVSEKTYDDFTSSRVFAVGSLNALAPQIFSESGFANKDFMLNTVSWMTERKDQLIIRPKKITPDFITATKEQVIAITIVLYVLPLVIIVLGIIIWLRRRYL